MINKIKKHMFRRTLVSTSHRKLDNYLNDIKNKIIYGTSGPLYAERIWVDPSCCKKAILLDISISGRVIKGNWPPNSKINVTPVEDLIKIKACIDHWVNGIPWEDTGIYEHMEDLIKSYGEYDGCKNIIDIKNRYKALDIIFNQIKIDCRIKTMKEINPKNYRELWGPVIHIGPDGELFFGGGAYHRFAIALILNLKLPVMIGCVHKSSIPLLKDLRKIANK